MKLKVLSVISSQPEWLKEVEEEFTRKIGFFFPFETQLIKSKKTDRDSADFKKQLDSQEILSKLTKDDFVILLDEKGKKFDSIQFAKKIETLKDQSTRKVVFVIGGAYGVSEELKKKANLTVSFSDMTFNHHLALAVLYEQLYRAMTIMHNRPYHNS